MTDYPHFNCTLTSELGLDDKSIQTFSTHFSVCPLAVLRIPDTGIDSGAQIHILIPLSSAISQSLALNCFHLFPAFPINSHRLTMVIPYIQLEQKTNILANS